MVRPRDGEYVVRPLGLINGLFGDGTRNIGGLSDSDDVCIRLGPTELGKVIDHTQENGLKGWNVEEWR